MAMILALDTSAKSVSCALTRDGKVLASYFTNTGLTHSQTLLPMVESVLKIADVTINQVDALAVNAGPGSFTGVRIGVSAVKGLAFTNNLPCVAVSTLTSMAENIPLYDGVVVCGVMDARCQQVYTALFRGDSAHTPVRITQDAAMTISDLEQQLNTIEDTVILVGDGSEICYKALKERIPHLRLAPESIRTQSAVGTALAAERMFASGETLSAEELLPIYLRLPQAERELNSRLSNKTE